MYNKLVDEEDIPKSWEDLLDPKWKGKIAYADPNNWVFFMILSALLTLNTDGEEYNWKILKSLLIIWKEGYYLNPPMYIMA